MTMKKRRSKDSTKPFVVFARFEQPRGGTIEMCKVRGKTMLTALRRGAGELWRRPAVKWKHHITATFTIQKGAGK